MKKRIRRSVLAFCLGLLLVGTAASHPVMAERESFSTLKDKAVLTGSGTPGDPFLVVVYNYNYGNEQRILYQTSGVLPPGGLYQLEVPLPVLGVQYVEAVIGGTKTVYEYIRYPQDLPLQLSAYYLNIYDFLNREP